MLTGAPDSQFWWSQKHTTWFSSCVLGGNWVCFVKSFNADQGELRFSQIWWCLKIWEEELCGHPTAASTRCREWFRIQLGGGACAPPPLVPYSFPVMRFSNLLMFSCWIAISCFASWMYAQIETPFGLSCSSLNLAAPPTRTSLRYAWRLQISCCLVRYFILYISIS